MFVLHKHHVPQSSSRSHFAMRQIVLAKRVTDIHVGRGSSHPSEFYLEYLSLHTHRSDFDANWPTLKQLPMMNNRAIHLLTR